MLEKIKKILFETYWSEEQKWLFLSWFDDQQELIISEWVVTSDAPLHELVDNIYDEIDEYMWDIIYVVCDVVSEIIQLETMKDILSKDPQEYGFVLLWEDNSSGVILPAVAWISDAKHALYHIKKKYDIHGQGEVFVFRTDRIVISK